MASQIIFLKSLGGQCLCAALFGISSHVFYYIRGHRDREALSIVVYHLLLGSAYVGIQIAGFGIINGIFRCFFVSAFYFTALITSITVYRLLFHRLRRFPGPLAAKVTNLYAPYLNRKGKMHERRLDLFRKYGDFVRVGPNELMTLSIDALSKLHSDQSKCRKSTLFDIIEYKGAHSLHSLIDKAAHQSRRQVWDKAMTEKSLAVYEKYAQQTVHNWLEKLEELERTAQPVDMLLFATLIAYDMGGRVGFSREFGGINKGTRNRTLQLLDLNTGIVGQVGLLPWPLALGGQLNISPEKKEFEALAMELIDEREKQASPEKEDIVQHLLGDYHSKEPISFSDRNALYCDSQVILSASTLNIRPVLAFAFYALAKSPSLQEQLRAALSPLLSKSQRAEFSHADLGTVELLDAIIHETMRLWNPTCDNAPRMTPPEGVTIGDTYIPGDVVVHAPIWAFHRSEKYFRQPDEFIPERWTNRPDLIIEKHAFHPFLIGPHMCIGRSLSYTLLRMVISYTVWHYDFNFAPGEDGSRIERESKHAFFLKPGRLELVFKKRLC